MGHSLVPAWLEQTLGSCSPALGYDIEEIDPAGCHPELVEKRPEFRARLHSRLGPLRQNPVNPFSLGYRQVAEVARFSHPVSSGATLCMAV
jgi:hypothetical protein